MIYVNEGTPIIGVNALHHPNRQRFTIAHECGHLILHKPQITKEVHVDKALASPMLMRDSVSAAGVDEMEIEANLFAAELLMPKAILAKALGNEPFDMRPLVCKRRTASSLKARSNRRPLFPFCFDICTSCDQNPIAGRLHFRQQGP